MQVLYNISACFVLKVTVRLFVISLKVKCPGGLMFCSNLVIGVFFELALACRSLADFEEHFTNERT